MPIVPGQAQEYNGGAGVLADTPFLTNDYSIQLVTVDYTFDATHSTVADLGANVVSGEGQLLSNKTSSQTDNNNYRDADDLSYVSLPQAKAMVLTQGPATANTTDKLIAYIDLNNGTAANTTVESIPFDATGLLRFT